MPSGVCESRSAVERILGREFQGARVEKLSRAGDYHRAPLEGTWILAHTENTGIMDLEHEHESSARVGWFAAQTPQ